MGRRVYPVSSNSQHNQQPDSNRFILSPVHFLQSIRLQLDQCILQMDGFIHALIQNRRMQQIDMLVSMNTYCLIQTCLKYNTFKIIFHFHHAELCRTVTHFIIVAHLSLSRITVYFLQQGLSLAFVDIRLLQEKNNVHFFLNSSTVFMGNTHLLVIHFWFRVNIMGFQNTSVSGTLYSGTEYTGVLGLSVMDLCRFIQASLFL